MSKQPRFEQMSIYDFLAEPLAEQVEKSILQDEKSQEVAPSETLPQVDEAQETVEFYTDVKLVAKQTVPSSALDAVNLGWTTEEIDSSIEVMKPTEDTDSTLFSVGDYFKVVSASSLYDTDIDPESYYYLLDYQGKTLEVKSIGDCYVITVGGQIFNFNEIIKI